MASKRAASSKRSSYSSFDAQKPLPLIMLLVGLALSAFNLSLMTSQAGTLTGVTEAFELLQENYATSRKTAVATSPDTSKKEVPAPTVLFSVAKFREGEEASLRTGLTEPLVAFYEETRWPIPLSAVLIERRNASSKDVNVRLFFSDGTESSYLWPRTNSMDGKWVPPCTTKPAATSPDMPLCPPMFSSRYPDLVDLTR